MSQNRKRAGLVTRWPVAAKPPTKIEGSTIPQNTPYRNLWNARGSLRPYDQTLRRSINAMIAVLIRTLISNAPSLNIASPGEMYRFCGSRIPANKITTDNGKIVSAMNTTHRKAAPNRRVQADRGMVTYSSVGLVVVTVSGASLRSDDRSL